MLCENFWRTLYISGKYGYVRYTVKMELGRPRFQSNKRTSKAFTVVPTIDLNNVSQAVLPAKKLKAKKLGIALFRHGDVTIECETQKSGFVPGEVIVVNARVINGSSKDIVKAQVELIEISTYVSNSYSLNFEPTLTFIDEDATNRRRQERRRLAAEEQLVNIVKHSEGDVELHLQVPSTAPSFDCCPIIKVEYAVEVKFKSSGSLNRHIAIVPVVIGTIPLLGTVTRNRAPQSLPCSSQKEIKSIPSRSGDSDGDSLNTMLVPNYEESINGVNGTTIDKSKMEPFAPRYPFYHQLSEVYKNQGPASSGEAVKAQ
ncbi:hypothetical protein Y032_0203g1847 [Ancylostoma ceylanicum]|uniref:Arrestin C-terminal-like domain-containing protein n=1 Tax=Ancylostoma ceylanicum TaxID=53326 RepID=A0A016SMV0_9BILA|nr:hypothetical protein Y032_0203g1847 [Ancylostoma ceylanicum]